MEFRTMEIVLDRNSYKIHIGKGLLNLIAEYISKLKSYKKIAIITDEHVNMLYGAQLLDILSTNGVIATVISLIPGEQSKSMETLLMIYNELAAFKLGREDLIITFGGGVVGDIGGYAAATYLRGVDYIQIPTTLLAQVDSSIGGKVAVDLPAGKNLVGSFYHPKAVYIDPNLLQTLSRRFLHDGLAEVIKYGCIKDSEILQLLNGYGDDELLNNIEELIYKCCNIKKDIVEKDEKDFGDRMLLNFGHTLGHAIEKIYDYKKFTHGEAVAIGMLAMMKSAERKGITKAGTYDSVYHVMKKFELPVRLEPAEGELDKILELVLLDKKISGNCLKLVLLKELGQGFIQKVSFDEIKSYAEGLI